MKRRKYFLLALVFLITIATFFITTFRNFKAHEKASNYQVQLTDSVDPDIVLINLEEGDRAFIGNLLLKIDSCKPYLIAIDATFEEEKDEKQDSVLMNALQQIKNDVLGYVLDSNDKAIYPLYKFRSHSNSKGSLHVIHEKELAVAFYPVETFENEIHEHFALKVVELWKPGFKHPFKNQQQVPIKFQRTLEQFVHFKGSQLKESDCEKLQNKIVLVGYIGPREEDKHFTPMRHFGRFDADEPDTYGLIILANLIRTILEYQK